MTTARREQTRKGLSMLLGTPTPPARAPREEPRVARQESRPVPRETRVEQAPSSTNGSPVLPLSAIDPDPEQPRKTFEEEALRELAESIRELGMLQPITVRPNPSQPGRYLVMTGERRYRAAKRLGLPMIPALIGSPEAQGSLREAQMVENIHREALTPMEIASYLREKRIAGLQNGEIAALIKKSPAFVTRHLSLVNLPKPLQEAYDTGKCRDVSVMYELRNLHKESPQKTETWLSTKGDVELTRTAIRELRSFLERPALAPVAEPVAIAEEKPTPANGVEPTKARSKDVDADRSEELSRLLGTRVQIEASCIRISYLNLEELARIESMLKAGATQAE
jgi:ParB family chromosome partitioning protein